jgi:capsular exopolysaccharide synthesis family protein
VSREKPLISLSEFLTNPSENPGGWEESSARVPAVDGGRPGDLRDAPVETADVSPESRIVMFSEPRGPGADRYRYLRMQLRELGKGGELKKILITSALPGDGKSTVALNLATALAEGGKRSVLLVESDLHRPTLTSTLRLTARAGLAECLEGDLSPLAAVVRIEPLNWYLLQAGEVRTNPTELLQSSAVTKVIDELAPHFDWVLFDSPPVAPLSDAVSLVRHTDACLLVVRAHQTPREAVEDALEVLGPGRVSGIVFNGASGLNRLYAKYSGYYGKRQG